eukprot:1147998-Pelagomonas_calceolata.AAC.2
MSCAGLYHGQALRSSFVAVGRGESRGSELYAVPAALDDLGIYEYRCVKCTQNPLDILRTLITTRRAIENNNTPHSQEERAGLMLCVTRRKELLLLLPSQGWLEMPTTSTQRV